MTVTIIVNLASFWKVPNHLKGQIGVARRLSYSWICGKGVMSYEQTLNTCRHPPVEDQGWELTWPRVNPACVGHLYLLADFGVSV